MVKSFLNKNTFQTGICSKKILRFILTVMVSLGEMVRVQSVIVLVHRTIQKVLWIITHELSDPGGAKKMNYFTDSLNKCRDHLL